MLFINHVFISSDRVHENKLEFIMKTRHCTLLSILFASGIALAQSISPEQLKEEAEALKDCGANQNSMNLCAHHEFRTADAELNRLYKELMERFKGLPSGERLKVAQRAWLRFVDADCLYQSGPPGDGGSSYNMEIAFCRAGHMRERIKALASYVSCTQNGCPI
jgi:uncharacterized protein YecT (DUF1311 family)